MKKKVLSATLAMAVFAFVAFTPATNKLISSKTHVKFFSSTPAEDIEANNYKSVSTLDTKTGDVVFSVPMQSFEFEKALMQKHYNSDMFLDTKPHPKAKLVARIINLSDINFEKNGIYATDLKGEMTIKGKTNSFTDKGTITVNGSVIKASSKFNIKLVDYGIAFEKGKPSTNIAKTVEVTVEAEYKRE